MALIAAHGAVTFPAASPRRLKPDVLARLGQVALTIGQQVLVLPVLLHYWGVEQYDVWLAAWAAAQFLALLDCGLGSHFSNELTSTRLREPHRYEACLSKA